MIRSALYDTVEPSPPSVFVREDVVVETPDLALRLDVPDSVDLDMTVAGLLSGVNFQSSAPSGKRRKSAR